MNQRPHEPLDAEQRALAALLPRPHGRAEPGADLDARILAAARAATQPSTTKPAVPRRRSWIAPTAVAASLMLAVGLAWQLRPPPSLETSTSAAASAPADADADAGSDAMVARAFEAVPPPASVATPMPQPVQMKPAPSSSEPVPSAEFARAARVQAAPAEPEMAAVAAPPPAPPAPVVVDSPAPMAETQMAAPARMAAPAMAKSASTDEASRERAAAAGNAAAQAQDASERAAADAATLDTVTIASPEEPDEDVPPATADSPEVRDAWLRRIGELLKQGKTEDAKASLAEFRRRYPEVTLPPELRKLEH